MDVGAADLRLSPGMVEVFRQGGFDVYLEPESFLRLLERPSEVEIRTHKLKVSRVLLSGSLRYVPDDDRLDSFATFSAQISVEVLTRQIPLVIPLVEEPEVAWTRIVSSDESVFVGTLFKGSTALYLVAMPSSSGENRHVDISADFAVKLDKDSGKNILSFSIPPAASSSLKFGIKDLHEPLYKISVARSVIRSEGTASLECELAEPGSVQISVLRKRFLEVQNAGAVPPTRISGIVHSTLDTLYTVTGSSILVDVMLKYTMSGTGKGKSSIELGIDGCEVAVLSVDTETYSSKEVLRVSDNFQRLTIHLSRPIRDGETHYAHIVVERPVENMGKFEIHAPKVRSLDLERESGHVGICAGPNVEVSATKVSGLQRVDVSELPASIKEGVGSNEGHGSPEFTLVEGYKYIKPDAYEFHISATEHRDLAVMHSVIERMYCRAVYSTDLALFVYYIEVRTASQRFLRILPNGRDKGNFEILGVYVDGKISNLFTDSLGNYLIPLRGTADGSLESYTLAVIQHRSESMKTGGVLDEALFGFNLAVNHFFLRVDLPRGYKYSEFEGVRKVSAFSDNFPEECETAQISSDNAENPIKSHVLRTMNNFGEPVGGKVSEFFISGSPLNAGTIGSAAQETHRFESLLVDGKGLNFSVSYKKRLDFFGILNNLWDGLGCHRWNFIAVAIVAIVVWMLRKIGWL